MFEEKERRRIDFQAGVKVELADGCLWTLPLRQSGSIDPEFEALLAAIREAEDNSESLRLELALTIFLLNRNYLLSADQIGTLLSFSPDDATLNKLQEDVRQFVLRFSPASDPPTPSEVLETSQPSPGIAGRNLTIRPIH